MIPSAEYDRAVISYVANTKTYECKCDLTVKIEVIHGSNIGLGLPTNESDTFWFTAITRLRFVTTSGAHMSDWEKTTVGRPKDVPVTVDVVIESELFIFLYITTGKDTHAVVASNGPLGYITIWRAAVI